MSQLREEATILPTEDVVVRHAGNTPYRLLDAWRGVAALWVILLHTRLPTTPEPLAHICSSGHLGVPMFFVISGYCIAHAAVRSQAAPRPITKFALARIRRIYPPYLLAAFIAIALSLTMTVLIQQHVLQSSQLADLNLLHQGWGFYLGTLTLTQLPLHTDLIIRVIWSLCYEVTFYAIFAVLLLIPAWGKSAPRLLDMVGLITFFSLLWQNFGTHLAPFPWDLWPQFGFGVLVYQVLAQPKRRIPKVVFTLCAAFAVVYAVRHHAEMWVDGLSTGFEAAFTLGFAVALLLLFRWDSRLSRLPLVQLLAGVGLFSYSLYLIHLLALGIVTQGLNRIHVLDPHPWLLYALRFATCLVVGRLFFHFCERPFLDTRQRQAEREAAADIPPVPLA